MYLMNLGFVFSTFGKVLKPVGGLIDGAKNVIFHPLATLNKEILILSFSTADVVAIL